MISVHQLIKKRRIQKNELFQYKDDNTSCKGKFRALMKLHHYKGYKHFDDLLLMLLQQ